MSRLSSSQIFPDADLPQRTVLEQIIGVLPLLQHRQDILCYEKSGERIAIDLYFADVLHRNIGIKPQKFSDIELALCGCQNVRVGEDSVYPTNAVSLDFADNELEYRLRYLPYHRDALLKQLFYLDSLLHYCREIGTRVAVVNMPLLPENIALLPNGAYAEYLESIGRKAQVNNAVFLDLNRPDLFNRSDFKTPVHLNGAGGIKFSNALSALIEITLRENGQVAWLGGICSLNVMRTHLRHQ